MNELKAQLIKNMQAELDKLKEDLKRMMKHLVFLENSPAFMINANQIKSMFRDCPITTLCIG